MPEAWPLRVPPRAGEPHLTHSLFLGHLAFQVWPQLPVVLAVEGHSYQQKTQKTVGAWGRRLSIRRY